MNENKADAKILERIRKLLALADNRGATEAEALLAAEKANALLAEYNLTRFDLMAIKPDDVVLHSELKVESRPWHRPMVTECAHLYFCEAFYTFTYETPASRKGYLRFDQWTFVGAPHNVQVAAMFGDYLVKAVERLAKEAAAKEPAASRSAFITAFKVGAGQRIARRLAERRMEAEKGLRTPAGLLCASGSTLPALANHYLVALDAAKAKMAEMGEAFTKEKPPTVNKADAFKKGVQAGDGVGLDRQVGGGKASATLPSAGAKPGDHRPGHLLPKPEVFREGNNVRTALPEGWRG